MMFTPPWPIEPFTAERPGIFRKGDKENPIEKSGGAFMHWMSCDISTGCAVSPLDAKRMGARCLKSFSTSPMASGAFAVSHA